MAPEVEHIRAYTMACLEMLGKLQEVTAKSDFSDIDAETFPKNPSGPFLRGISPNGLFLRGLPHESTVRRPRVIVGSIYILRTVEPHPRGLPDASIWLLPSSDL